MRWQRCAQCQARIRSEGLTDEFQLQSWFIRRISAFLKRHNRRLIGWDEILEGGLAPDAIVMSWRVCADVVICGCHLYSLPACCS